MAFYKSGERQIIFGEFTGAQNAALGSNCPANDASAPHTWFKFKTLTGETVFVPVWK